jgi:hypothetical protein
MRPPIPHAGRNRRYLASAAAPSQPGGTGKDKQSIESAVWGGSNVASASPAINPNLVDASSTTRSHMGKVRRTLVVAVFAAVALLSVSIPAFAASSIKVHNKSKWEIHHLFLSPTSEKDEWGPDQLGDAVIKANGGTFTLTDIECNKYDIKIVDEDGDECIVSAVSLCDDSAVWNITDERLLKCEKKSE